MNEVISFSSNEDGLQKLREAVHLRDQMGGALYWGVCEDTCLRLADKLSAAGADKNVIALIGGWEMRK